MARPPALLESDFATTAASELRYAARQGLQGRKLATMATALGELAITAAVQHPERYDPVEVAITSAYLESFTFRGLAPADVLAQKLDHPMDALAWAAPEHATKGAA